MKTILFSVVLALTFAANANHNNENVPHGDKYCMELRSGILTVMYQGSPITSDVSLDNGSTLKTDGTIVRKDGTRTTLLEGECVTHEGKVFLKSEVPGKVKSPK